MKKALLLIAIAAPAFAQFGAVFNPLDPPFTIFAKPIISGSHTTTPCVPGVTANLYDSGTGLEYYCSGVNTWSALSTSSGTPSFATVTAGTNTSALVVGTGGSLTVSGTGTINATSINGATVGTATATSGNLLIGSGTQWVSNALSQDCTITSAGVITCLKTNNVAFTSAATTAIGTSGAVLGLLNGNLTFGGTDTLTNAPTITALGGGGQLCVHVTNAGLLGVAAADCGSGGGGGTVTSIATNNGITGGTITTTGTIGLASIANNQVLCNNSGSSGVPSAANCTVTGTGNAVLATSPVLTTPGATTINDANGNPFIKSTATASAVDSITITNAAAANPATVAITASGTDANINLNLVTKGSGVLQCNGVTCPVGTVTSIATNNGITGGTITSSGTVGLASVANNSVLCNNSGGSAVPTAANCAVTGTGNNVLATSPTLTTPKVNTVNDANGNPFIAVTATASAVDGITITNAATGSPATVSIAATGTDGNINLNLVSKGSGTIQCNGSNCIGGGGTLSGGTVVTETTSYTFLTTDSGNEFTFNGTSLTGSLPAVTPSMPWMVGAKNLAATDLTISRNGNTINGGTSNIVLKQYMSTVCFSDTVTMNNYVCDVPIVAGSNITLTPAANGITVASSGGGSSLTVGTTTITSGTTGRPLYDNGGVLGEYSAIPIANGGTNATSAAAGTMPNATSSSASSWTATPTLGASGTLGSLTLGNATSGLLTIQPVTGALGTVTASLPANTGTVAELNLAQSWSALQTFPGGDLFCGGVDAQTGTTYTIVAGDACKLTTYNNGSSVAVTLPQATTAGFGAGAFFYQFNRGAGAVTITPTTSTINGGTTITLNQNQGAFVMSDGTNYSAWVSSAPSGSGTVTSATIAGTANQITASGTCTITTSGTCTLSLPSALTVPGSLTLTTLLNDAVNSVSSGASPNFDLSLGNVQTISSLANNATATFSNIASGRVYYFLICQDATGGRTFTWPATAHGAMTIGSVASECSAQSFYSNGTNLYALAPGIVNQ